MRTKLREGQVVTCLDFAKGNMKNEIIHVGNYDDNYIYGMAFYVKHNAKDYTHGEPCVDENRGKREFLILKVSESEPQLTLGNRMTSYTNKMFAIELNEDGTYNENNQKITFYTNCCLKGAINEDNIQIVAEMKKVYVRQEL